MLPGLNPKKMNAMMKQMGIAQDEIDAEKVTIEKTDGTKIIVNQPSVVKVSMQGQDSFQISGDVSEEAGEQFSEDDIKTVVEKTGCDAEKAKQVLEEKNGDLAEAILELSK